jgi:DNA-binding PucR family transcriptional regulator
VTPRARAAGADEVPAAVLAEVAAGGSADAGAVPVELLGDFLAVLAGAVRAGTPITAARLRSYRTLGERAARQGVALRALLDLYLSAAWRLWPHLPPVRNARSRPDDVVVAGQVMLHAVDDVVAALAEGFQLARRTLVRAQESARREFIDDLLSGTSDVAGVVHRAGGFGLDLSGPHSVAIVAAEREFVDGSPLIASLERSILGLKGDAQALLASKEGRLVVVFAAPDQAAVAHVSSRLADTLRRVARGRAAVGGWQIGVGRAGTGADGVVAAYRDARQALDLAGRLELHTDVVELRDLLVYQVLLRDPAALAGLVEDTFSGLRDARGGAAPLVHTIAAYYAAGSNATAAARSLHLSVRAVTYRLDRIRDLTGRDPDLPEDRFVLHVATRGAQLLGWPTVDSSA